MNILIGGEAGQGLVTIGQLLGKALVRSGYFIGVTQKVNTYAWYRDRCYPLSPAYDPTDWEEAMKMAREWGDKIPVGIIYRNDRVTL